MYDDEFYEPYDPEKKRTELRAQYGALSIAELANPARPDRAFIIDGVIPEGSVVSIIAPSEHGKSTLARSLSFAISIGWDTFGGLRVSGHHRVFYLDLENSDDDWAEEFKDVRLTPEQRDVLAERLFIITIPPPPLDTDEGGRLLTKLVTDVYGLGRGDVVILDSAQRITGGDENASRTWQDFYRYTAWPLRKAGVTLILLDNTGKTPARGARGSSSKHDQVDVEWTMNRRGQRVELHRTKTRARGVRPHLLLERIDTDAGHRYVDAANAANIVRDAKARADAQVIIDAGLWAPGAQLPSHRELVDLTKAHGLGDAPAGSATPAGWGGNRVTAALAELRKPAGVGVPDA